MSKKKTILTKIIAMGMLTFLCVSVWAITVTVGDLKKEFDTFIVGLVIGVFLDAGISIMIRKGK